MLLLLLLMLFQLQLRRTLLLLFLVLLLMLLLLMLLLRMLLLLMLRVLMTSVAAPLLERNDLIFLIGLVRFIRYLCTSSRKRNRTSIIVKTIFAQRNCYA